MTPREGLIKAQKYCVYQDRCHQEVRRKLIEWGIFYDDLEAVIVELIQENFLNEERFSMSFARGKFRMKKWGRIKIISALKQRQISEYCIKKGLAEIEEEEYLQTLKAIIVKRDILEKSTNTFVKKQKIAKYLISRGFESDLVWENLN